MVLFNQNCAQRVVSMLLRVSHGMKYVYSSALTYRVAVAQQRVLVVSISLRVALIRRRTQFRVPACLVLLVAVHTCLRLAYSFAARYRI